MRRKHTDFQQSDSNDRHIHTILNSIYRAERSHEGSKPSHPQDLITLLTTGRNGYNSTPSGCCALPSPPSIVCVFIPLPPPFFLSLSRSCEYMSTTRSLWHTPGCFAGWYMSSIWGGERKKKRKIETWNPRSYSLSLYLSLCDVYDDKRPSGIQKFLPIS